MNLSDLKVGQKAKVLKLNEENLNKLQNNDTQLQIAHKELQAARNELSMVVTSDAWPRAST